MKQTAKDAIIVLGALVLGLLLVTAFLFYVGAIRVPLLDVWREGTQHSQQYVETKRSLLLSLIADVEGAQTPEHERAITARFCEEYNYVDFDVPTSVRAFADANC